MDEDKTDALWNYETFNKKARFRIGDKEIHDEVVCGLRWWPSPSVDTDDRYGDWAVILKTPRGRYRIVEWVKAPDHYQGFDWKIWKGTFATIEEAKVVAFANARLQWPRSPDEGGED